MIGPKNPRTTLLTNQMRKLKPNESLSMAFSRVSVNLFVAAPCDNFLCSDRPSVVALVLV